MCLGGYAGKNVYKASKTSALFSGVASGANRCYVVAHCVPPPFGKKKLFPVCFFEGFPNTDQLCCEALNAVWIGNQNSPYFNCYFIFELINVE